MFRAALEATEGQTGPAWWFAFRDGGLLVRCEGDLARIPCLTDISELGLQPGRRHYLGALGSTGCWAVELEEDQPLPENMELEPLRGLYGRLDEDLFAVAGRAVQVVEWRRTHQFCGRCGAQTEDLPRERATVCPVCRLTTYPRLSPAVIVLVSRGDEEVLLARSHHFPTGMYSILAGFVEPGESLEETVVREIGEEAGVEVRDIRYWGSQPWPYPNSLMIGFTATYAGGEISLDEREIADAGWFKRDNLPGLPGKLSIARKMLDWWVQQQAT
ncbi:MAG: NAD(+) diphosphatase [Chloroflexota bacterium]|nr:NAD(+) diphosphatase [Chloroflexota bacterium]